MLGIPPMNSLAGVMNELLQNYGYNRSTIELRISNICARNVMKSRYAENEILQFVLSNCEETS